MLYTHISTLAIEHQNDLRRTAESERSAHYAAVKKSSRLHTLVATLMQTTGRFNTSQPQPA
jgi:hypothetical protein